MYARFVHPIPYPIFVTEIGYTLKWRGDARKNLWQAAGMTAYQYYARHARQLRLFPGVQYHSPLRVSVLLSHRGAHGADGSWSDCHTMPGASV